MDVLGLGVIGPADRHELDLDELVRLILVELKEVVDYNAASLILIAELMFAHLVWRRLP